MIFSNKCDSFILKNAVDYAEENGVIIVASAGNEALQEVLTLLNTLSRSHMGCAILSHGDEGIVYGTDFVVEIDTLLEPIKQCPSLRGKPKLFFIQVSPQQNVPY